LVVGSVSKLKKQMSFHQKTGRIANFIVVLCYKKIKVVWCKIDTTNHRSYTKLTYVPTYKKQTLYVSFVGGILLCLGF